MNQHLALAIAALWVAPFSAASAGTPVDREIDAGAKGTVEVRNVSGSIDVGGWNRHTVHVTGMLSDNVERLDVVRDGDRVRVEVVLHKDWHSADREGTSLKISVPQGSRLEASAVSSSIGVRGVEGEQELNSVSGSITTEALGSDLTLSTVSGSVTAQGHDGSAVARARSVSGSVELIDISGEISAEAVSGSIEVKGAKISRAMLNTVSGRASLRGGLADDARVELTSTSGMLEMQFTGKAEADYDLQSFSGSIKSCFGPPVTQAQYGPQREQRFREGASNARVHAHTMSGRIDLCRE